LAATLAALFILLALALYHPIIDGDVFFYLSLGREILRTGALPPVDPFLYSITQWNITHEWLAYLVYYSAWTQLGFFGVYIVSALPWFSIFGFLSVTAVRKQVSGVIFCLLLLVAGFICAQRFIDRASLVSDALTAALACYLLFSPKISRVMGWILPAIFCFWINWHPGFLAGLTLLAGFVIIKRTGLLVFLYCLVACCVNPAGLQGVFYPFMSTASTDWEIFRKINFEWMPSFQQPMIGSKEVQVFIGLAAVTLIFMIRATLKEKHKMWLSWLVASMLGYLVQDAVRFLPTAALGCLVLFIYSWTIAPIAFSKWRQMQEQIIGQGLVLVAALGLSVFVLNNGYSPTSGPREVRLGLDEPSFPVAALDFIQSKKLEGRFFNQYEWGSFLIWSLDKKSNLFIHTHVDNPHFLQDEYYGISSSPEKFIQTVSQKQIDYFLLDSKIFLLKPQPGILDSLKGWKVLYQDQVATLWGRADRN
jgi:hypothetical protein